MSERRLISWHTNNLKSNTVQSLKASAPCEDWEVGAPSLGGGVWLGRGK